MSDAVFVEPEAEPEPELESIAEDDPTPEKPKSRRKKAPMDEETKERLLSQLATGRETASKNRKIKAEAKKLKEKQAQPAPVEPAQDYLKQELSELRTALKELLAVNKALRDNSEIKRVKEEIKEAKEAKEDVATVPTPTLAPAVTPPVPRIATSRGIRSRWDKYN